MFFFGFVFCFSVWGTLPCYLLHFGAKTRTLLKIWNENLPFALFIDFSMVFIEFAMGSIDFFHGFNRFLHA